MFVVPPQLPAQDTRSTPSEVVARIMSAHDSADIPTLLALAHLEAMEEFKRLQLRHDSVFAMLAAALPADNRRGHSLFRGVFCVRDRSEFERLPAVEVLRRWFRTSLLPPLGDTAAPSRPEVGRTIVGEVQESDSVVHVVFREELPEPFADPPGSTVRVMTVRRTPQGWRSMLNGGLVLEAGGGWGIGYDDENPRC